MKLHAQELVADGILGHMVIECLANTSMRLCERVAADKCCDVVLTVNGEEMDLEGFVKHWENQVQGMIERKARNLAHKLLDKLADDFSEVHERLRTDIDRYKFELETVNEQATTANGGR